MRIRCNKNIASSVVLLVVLLAGIAHADVGGMISPTVGGGWYPAGTNLTVTATPNLYSKLDRWDGDTGNATFGENQITFKVDASKTVTAVFTPEVTTAGAVPHYWLNDINPIWTTAFDFEAAATNDLDGDGFTTEQEYWAGTDPADPESYLRIAGVERSGEACRLVSSHARVDSRIAPLRIEGRASMLSGDWEYVDQKQPVEGSNEWEIPASAHRFFRLSVDTP